MKKFKVLDLFSGAGGFGYGLSMNENFEIVVANDFNKYALETLKKNNNKISCVLGDILDENIKSEIIRLSKKNKVNMIIGGPPCQGFSLKGKKLGINDKRNFLFKEYFEIVKEIMPNLFIIENVKNILNSENGYFINEIKNIANELGYIVSYKVLNAKDYGVPQNRERAIIIGSKNIKINFPNKVNKIITVMDAIGDLSYLNSGEGEFEGNYVMNAISDYQKHMRVNSKKLYNHISTNHNKVALEKLNMIPPESGKEFLPSEMRGKQIFNSTWSRLKWNDVSPTIDTRFDTPSNGKNSHPYLNRSITPREAARLQSFDDSYIFYGNKTEICKQIGNAVPPLLAKAIADNIVNELSLYKRK